MFSNVSVMQPRVDGDANENAHISFGNIRSKVFGLWLCALNSTVNTEWVKKIAGLLHTFYGGIN